MWLFDASIMRNIQLPIKGMIHKIRHNIKTSISNTQSQTFLLLLLYVINVRIELYNGIMAGTPLHIPLLIETILGTCSATPPACPHIIHSSVAFLLLIHAILSLARQRLQLHIYTYTLKSSVCVLKFEHGALSAH